MSTINLASAIRNQNATEMQVNDILVSSWGFDQTNIDFYKVVKVSGSFVTVVLLESEIIETRADFTGLAMPIIDSEKGTKLRRKVNCIGGIQVRDYAYAKLWDGKAKTFSTYA